MSDIGEEFLIKIKNLSNVDGKWSIAENILYLQLENF